MLFEYETDRLLLKILKPESAAAVLDFYMRDKELFEYYEPERVRNFYTIQHQANLLRCEYNLAFKQNTIRFYVFRKENPNQIIGTVCFHNIVKNLYSCCEVGYKFSSASQHMGYAAEALEKGLTLIFEDLALHRVTAWVLPENQPSIRLLERLSFSCEGLCRSVLPIRGEWRDHLLFARVSPFDTGKLSG